MDLPHAQGDQADDLQPALPESGEEPAQTEAERREELRQLRRLQMMMNLVMSVISQAPQLTLEEASQMAADARRSALRMFPGKELAFDLLFRPRLQRIMRERYHIQ